MQSWPELVEEFHVSSGQVIPELSLEHINTQIRNLRKKLLEEEYKEYLEGEDYNDLIEVLDGLLDMVYVILGTCLSYGVAAEKIDVLFREIHRSNMTKLNDGQIAIDSNGKLQKGPNYSPPRIKELLGGCDCKEICKNKEDCKS